MRIVVDTNVIVSSLVFAGLPRRVFEAVESGRCEFYYSAEIESETRRVLLDKFGWNEERLDRYLPLLWGLGERVLPRRRVNAVKEDPDDEESVQETTRKKVVPLWQQLVRSSLNLMHLFFNKF